MSEIAAALIGALIGGLVSPILLEEYRLWRRERSWARPRKKMLKAELERAGGQGWVSFERLSCITGMKDEDCRTLLIEIGARGGRLKDGREGWILRRPPAAGAETSQPADDDDNG